MLRQMLTFNPYFRPDLNSCLAHPYFNSMRDSQVEMSSPLQIDLDFEKYEVLSSQEIHD